MDYQIRKVCVEERKQAMNLVWRVFQQFEAPDYPEEGINTFHEFITNEKIVEKMHIYGAFIGQELVGVLATRSNGTHISLFFVEPKYHRQGIGRILFEYLCKERTGFLTVNAAPYATEIYHHLGFGDQDTEQMQDGIRYTPMKIKL